MRDQSQAEKTTNSSSNGSLVFVVEDDRAYAKVFERKLQMEGFSVLVWNSTEGVIDSLTKEKPSVILLDLVLPGKSGFDLLQEIRAEKRFNDIKVIISSNLSQPVDQKKAIETGADDYFIKSNVSIQEMIERVKHVIAEPSKRATT
jgi:DNA-binding response OmpR family regulator